MSLFNDKEAEFKPSTKSEDEIRRMTLDEDLAEVDRAFIILMKGQQIQKKSVYANIHHVFSEKQAFDRLFKSISDDIQYQDEDTQIILANSLKKYIQSETGQSVKDEHLIKIYCLCTQIIKVWSFQVLNAWYEVLDALIQKGSNQSIFNEMVQLALNLTDQTQPTTSRYLGARMIGSLATILKQSIKGPLFDRSRILCQDSEIEIRKIVAGELFLKICLHIDTDMLETYILEKILELIYDSDIQVKCTAINMYFEISSKLSLLEQKNRVCKQFFEFMQSPNEEIIKVMSRCCGQVFLTLHLFLSQNLPQHTQFLHYFKVINHNCPDSSDQQYGLNPAEQVRINFAYNFPAVLSNALPNKNFDYFQPLYFKMLHTDTVPVQEQLLSSFSKIIQITKDYTAFTQAFIKLMESQRQSILFILINQYDQIVIHLKESFYSEIVDVTKDNNLVDLLEDIIQQSVKMLDFLEIQHQRENLSLFLTKFKDCQQEFKQNKSLDTHLIKKIQDICKKDCTTVRRLCAMNLAYYCSWTEDLKKRDEILKSMLEEYCESNNCYERMTAIDFISFCGEYFSISFMESWNMFKVFNFANEKVKNVIIRLCQNLPQITQKICYLQEDLWENTYDCLSILKKLKNGSFHQIYQHCYQEMENKRNLNDEELELIIQKNEMQELNEQELQIKYVKQQQMEQDIKEEYEFHLKGDSVNEYINKYRNKQNIYGTKVNIIFQYFILQYYKFQLYNKIIIIRQYIIILIQYNNALNQHVNPKYKLIASSSSNGFKQTKNDYQYATSRLPQEKISSYSEQFIKRQLQKVSNKLRNSMTAQFEKKRLSEVKSVDKKLPAIKPSQTKHEFRSRQFGSQEDFSKFKKTGFSNISNLQKK